MCKKMPRMSSHPGSTRFSNPFGREQISLVVTYLVDHSKWCRPRSVSIDMNFKAFVLGLTLIVGAGLSCSDDESPGSGEEPSEPSEPEVSSPLEAGFLEPPQSARPFVWYHWLGGNVTLDGIESDLAWMSDIGIGGLQLFNVDASTPEFVPDPVTYMDAAWQNAFARLVELTASSGMEFGIASSPGWSATGGPWVSPEDGMKKVVWSEVVLLDGVAFDGVLPERPSVTGAFQDIDLEAILFSVDEGVESRGDIAVLALPIEADLAAKPSSVTLNGDEIESESLRDGSYRDGVTFESEPNDPPAAVEVMYDSPVTVRSLTAYLYGDSRNAFAPVFEVHTGEEWERVADVPLAIVPTTRDFQPVSARRFRLVLAPRDLGDMGGSPAMPNPISPMDPPPVDLAEFRLSGLAQIDRAELKAGFEIESEHEAPGDGAATSGVPIRDVVDLTELVAENGRLVWTPPDSRTWRILCFGYSLTGSNNSPAAVDATGLEVDKYNAEAVRRYLDTYLAMVRKADDGFDAFLTDSIEAGPSNWTPDLISRFRELRGYDPTRWLPTLTGTIIGSREESEKFLYDYRATLSELVATEYYETIAEFTKEEGLVYYSEAIEGVRSMLGDDMAMRAPADIPMAAFWTFSSEEGPDAQLLGDMKGASSVANIYGQNLVALEALTAFSNPWGYAPSELRPMIDIAFAYGINRPVIHTSPHQPLDAAPGASLFTFGQMFSRHETWADQARVWTDYLARSSFLLQQGSRVVDIGYVYGEDLPVTELYAEGIPEDAPARYAFDFVNRDALLNHLSVTNGQIVSSGGTHYKALYLGETTSFMTLRMLEKLAELTRAGATIIGKRPNGSRSLQDPESDYEALAESLWSGAYRTQSGRGRVFDSRDADGVLAELEVNPGFSVADGETTPDLLFVQRGLADGSQLFFVTNQSSVNRSFDARFAVTGRIPRLFHADTGDVVDVSYQTSTGFTEIPLEIAAQDSVFVVFEQTTDELSRSVSPVSLVEVGEIDGPWRIAFEPGRGAPGEIEANELVSLSDNSDPGIRHFSGVATYSSEFELPTMAEPGDPLWLEFETVADIADVSVNGRALGTVWVKPYRVDVSSAVRGGTNRLEVDVANLWVNRLIADAALPENDRVSFTVFPSYSADTPLRPSGLIGSVRLFSVSESSELGEP